MRKNGKNIFQLILISIGILIIICIILASILTRDNNENVKIQTDIIHPQTNTATEKSLDEFIHLELTYLGSAKVKQNDVFMWDTEVCSTYPDALTRKEYTYSYRLFSSKED